MFSIPLKLMRKIWINWKSLRLPWRKKFLVGLDLQGNTFWEFRDSFSSHQNRMRRMVEYSRSVHNSDVQISPQWHQWLRHTRADAPSLDELTQDIVRRNRLKVLAATADVKWASKSNLLDTSGHLQDQFFISSQKKSVHSESITSPSITTSHVQENIEKANELNGLRSSSIIGADKPETHIGTLPSSKKLDSITETSSGAPERNPSHDFSSDQWRPKVLDGSSGEINTKSSGSYRESKNSTNHI